jgi:divalent anion:Na+ symporter, DASS family
MPEVSLASADRQASTRGRVLRAGIVPLAGAVVWFTPVPAGIEVPAWRLFSIFVAIVVGLIARPAPAGAIVLLGVVAAAATGVLTPGEALAGYADPTVWMVFCAFQIAGGMIKTGFGRRVALTFIRAIGHTPLRLAYALVATDAVFGMVIPSVTARSGGILFPISKSLAQAYDSGAAPVGRGLGAFLLPVVYHCDLIVCAMFLTGQASNPLIASFARQATGIELTYVRWALGALVPGLLALAITPLLLYYVSPPGRTSTPEALEFLKREIARLGRMTRPEWSMLGVFLFVTVLWSTNALHSLDYAVVALLGVAAMLVTRVLDWEDVLADRVAWDVFLWYGGIYQLASALAGTGIAKVFTQTAEGYVAGPWGVTLAALLLVYFYAHYGFASITAHASAMYPAFLLVLTTTGTPDIVAVLTLAYLSSLAASLTHYGTTSTPMYYGEGYLTQSAWWKVGFLVSVLNLVIWTVVGMAWWKALGWW